MKKTFTFLCLLMMVCSYPLLTTASSAKELPTGEMQGQNVQGVVTDTDGAPVIGATVIIQSSGLGSITDATGAFLLDHVKAGDIVEVSSVGYKVATFTVSGSRTSYDIVMEIDGLMTDEVVVTALGIERKASSLTYATQQVGNEEFSTAKDVNVINSLQGKAAGLVITPGSFGAGSSSKITMRGAKSVSGPSTPLIVIDGIPMNNPSTEDAGDGFVGYDGGDALSNLNPDDIASMNLLKGASAAALYGSMAANGVIMITTKKGAEGTVRISYSSNMTFDTILDDYNIQKDYGATVNGDGSLSETSWGSKLSGSEATGADRVKDFYQTAQTYINSLTVTGGTEKIQSFFSYANTYAKGMVEENKYNRHNITVRETFNLFNDRLKLDVNAGYIKQEIHNPSSFGTYSNPLTGLYTFPNNGDWNYYKNNYAEYNEVSKQTDQIWYRSVDNDFSANPYWVINKQPRDMDRERFNGSGTATLKITDYLNVQGRLAFESNTDATDGRAYDGTSLSLNGRAGGVYVVEQTKNKQFYGDLMANFNKSFGKWDISASLGGSFKQNSTNYEWISGNLVYTDIFALSNIDTSLGNKNLDSSYSIERLNSVFATAQIGFNDFLFADITARNDWSSCLAFTDNGSYFYPSGGLSFLVNEVADLGIVDLLKVRASYTVVGNDVTAYVTNPLNSVTNGNVVYNTSAPFTELEPEKMHSFEAGFDIALLDNALTAEFTYYKTNTKNQLFSVSAAAGTGYDYYYVNAGNIQNSGVELTLGYDWKINKDWRWMTSFNMSYNDNKVIELCDALDSEYLTLSTFGLNMRLYEGGSYGDVYGYDYVRDENGAIELDDNGTPQISSEITKVGNMNSDWQLGWNNNFKFKNWAASFTIDGRIGGSTYSATEGSLDKYGVSERTGIARDNGGVDNGAGVMIDAKTYYSSCASTEYLYDATNFRLREFTLGYTFRNLGGKSNSISVDFVARNLFFLYKKAPKDPDSGSGSNLLSSMDSFNLPSTRSFGLKLQFNF